MSSISSAFGEIRHALRRKLMAPQTFSTPREVSHQYWHRADADAAPGCRSEAFCDREVSPQARGLPGDGVVFERLRTAVDAEAKDSNRCVGR